MRPTLKQSIAPLMLTILFLFAFEIFMTTIFPFIGIYNHRLNIALLIILYLGFRLESPYLNILD